MLTNPNRIAFVPSSSGWWLTDWSLDHCVVSSLDNNLWRVSNKQSSHCFQAPLFCPRSSPLHSVWRLVTVVVPTRHGGPAPGSGGGVAQVLVHDDPPGVPPGSPAVPAHPHRALHPAPAARHRAHGRGALGPTVSEANNHKKIAMAKQENCFFDINL